MAALSVCAPCNTSNTNRTCCGLSGGVWWCSMSVHDLLQRLDKVRKTGPDKWSARCPAHDDKSPSLAIKETADGTILLKCFAGCGASDIVASLGLELKDLFPCNHKETGKPQRKPFMTVDGFRAVRSEITLVWLAANQIANGNALGPTDLERLNVAAVRINTALEYCQ